MTDTLIHAYAPLIIWTGLGLLALRWLPNTVPRFLGRLLYWVGVPVQIFTLVRQTAWPEHVGLAPILTLVALGLGLGLGWLGIQILHDRPPGAIAPVSPLHELPLDLPSPLGWSDAGRQGSFLLASMLGNTGFVGLAIVPAFIDTTHLGWVVFYSVTQNVVGTYGIGVLLASLYGRPEQVRGWVQVRDLLTVPSLWAFALSFMTRSIPFPAPVEAGLHGAVLIVIPLALLLMGMRLSQLNGWKSLKLGLGSSLIKVVILPGLVGLGAIALHLAPYPRLTLVLMSGMPTAFAGLILSEEYDLDRELIASSIVLSSIGLLVMLPIWLWLFSP